MSNVPLPKHKMLGLDQYGSPTVYGWTADQMHTHAAAVSAADNAALREALHEVLEFQSAPTQPTIHDWGRWRRALKGASHE